MHTLQPGPSCGYMQCCHLLSLLQSCLPSHAHPHGSDDSGHCPMTPLCSVTCTRYYPRPFRLQPQHMRCCSWQYATECSSIRRSRLQTSSAVLMGLNLTRVLAMLVAATGAAQNRSDTLLFTF